MKSELVIATRVRLTPSQWQDAINAERFLVPLVLVRNFLTKDSWVHGHLDNRPVSFRFEERAITESLVRAGFKHVFATPGAGDMVSCAAGGLAALAYMSGGRGEICIENGRRSANTGELKQLLDSMLAVGLDKVPAYRERYPDDISTPTEGGSATIVATLVG